MHFNKNKENWNFNPFLSIKGFVFSANKRKGFVIFPFYLLIELFYYEF